MLCVIPASLDNLGPDAHEQFLHWAIRRPYTLNPELPDRVSMRRKIMAPGIFAAVIAACCLQQVAQPGCSTDIGNPKPYQS